MKSKDSRSDTRFARRITVAAGLAAAMLQPGPLSAQLDCTLPGYNTPAVPVPECVDAQGFEVGCGASGARRLWPPSDFHPASGFPIAPKRPRDSTDRFAGTTIPGEKSGHELFRSVDVVTVGGVSRRLYAAYNAGFQVWDIESNPADPVHRTFRDGWTAGHFLAFPGVSEVLQLIEDIGALSFNSTTDVVGVAGITPVGVSLWEFTTSSAQLRQLYQDTLTNATQIRLVKRNNGTVYAFAGAVNGLAVYNVTTAKALTFACQEDLGQCPGVRRGFVGDTLNKSRIFIDVLHVPATDKIFVTASGGFNTFLEIWAVDPQNPALAQKLFSGLKHTLGSAIFQYNGHAYVAIVSEETGIDKEKLRIFLIDGCVSGGTCALTEAVSPISIGEIPTFKDFLTHSEIGGTPYLYYGAQTSNTIGPGLERLYNLSSLRPPNPTPLASLPEITQGGGTYADPCSGQTMSYWSHYYQHNHHGLNEMFPQVGKFSAQGYFYRAANSILDVHLLGDAPPPPPTETSVRVDVTNPAAPPYWMGQPITFTASVTPAGDCPGGTWSWDHTDNFTAQPSDTDDVAVINFGLCTIGDCPARNPFISASKSVCPDALSVAEQDVTVQDPRPHVRSVDVTPASVGGIYDAGTPLTFTATVDGRDDAAVSMTYNWTVLDGEGTTLLVLPPKVSSPTLELDTCADELTEDTGIIFVDGFESGSSAAWNSATTPTSLSTDEPKAVVASVAFRELIEKDGSVDFRMRLEATSSAGQSTHDQTPFTLLGAGPLAIGPGGLSRTPASQTSASGVTFNVDSNAAEVRWEIEDAGGTCVLAGNCGAVCDHYPAGCTVFDWAPAASASELTFVWEAPNLQGTTRRVRADVRKCENQLSLETSVVLDVVPVSVVPTVSLFEVHPDDVAPQNQPSASKPCVWDSFLTQDLKCRPNSTIRFRVTTDADPVSDYQFDWNDTGSFGSFTTTLTHSYPSTTSTAFTPAVKARKGTGVSQAADLSVPDFGLGVNLRIQSF